MNTARKRDDAELPDGWRMVRLGDVVEINKLNWDPSGGDPILYLDLTSVLLPGRLAEPREVAASEAPSRARRRVRSGDILISTVRPNLRGFARVKSATENLVASTGFAVLSPSSEANGSFVYHHVMADPFAANLEGAATGQAYPAVRPDDVGNYRIALPPLPEQRAIADVLDSIDDAIERTEAVIAATETLRDSLLHELLTRGVPGWHTQWKDVPGIGAIPADWEVVELRHILVVDQPGAWGADPSPENPGVLVLRAADLTRDGRVNAGTAARRCLSDRDVSRRMFSDGDIMLERSGGGPGTPVGRVALISGMGTVYCNNFCQQLRVDDTRCDPNYAVRALWHRYLRGVTARLEHQTTGIRNLDYNAYLSHPIALPHLHEQQVIIDVLNSAEGRLVCLREELCTLQQCKSSCATGLLSGRLAASITQPKATG